ncbi:glutathione synthase [Sporolactobacillus sp. THM7-4]|nr:glutathione synthase [Sporolactobacillus sp. THM7-4]
MPDKKRFSPSRLTTNGRFGLERENLRINPDGSLALTPHPEAFGDKLTNPEITTDFSESQVEIVTPVSSSIPEMMLHLDCLTAKVVKGIGTELLWPLSSTPAILPPEEQIPIADFGPDGRDKNDYRIYLSKKYGRYKQLYCGIHFNFSFLQEELSEFLTDQSMVNRFYLHLTAQAMRYRFFLVHLLSASPVKKDDGFYRSIRLGKQGYQNTRPIFLDYTDADFYVKSLSSYIKKGTIEGARELYQHVRIKGKGFEDPDSPPAASRVELRIPDLNPLYPGGINPDDLYLMHLYLMWAVQKEDLPFDAESQKEARFLCDQAAMMDVSDELSVQMNQMFDQLYTFLSQSDLPKIYSDALDHAKQRWLNPELRYAEQIAARTQNGKDMNEAVFLAKKMKETYMKMADSPCVP